MLDEAKQFFFFTACAVGGYWLWRSSARTRSYIVGTATAKIGTAAKGFAEVKGVARPVCAAPLHDPLTDQPCVWFRVESEERTSWVKDKWRSVGSARSARPLVVQDDTASAVILGELERGKPDEVIYETKSLRHSLWRIRNGEAIYVLGHIDRLASRDDLMRMYRKQDDVAVQSDPRYSTRNERVSGILKLWKQDHKRLVARFDTNQDGRLDDGEWSAARGAAQEIADKEIETSDPQYRPFESITHVLSKPRDGRPLIVSRHGEAAAAKSERSSSRFGLLLFLFGVIALAVKLYEWAGK